MVNEMLDFSEEDDDVSKFSELSSIHEEDIPVSVREIADTSGVLVRPLIVTTLPSKKSVTVQIINIIRN